MSNWNYRQTALITYASVYLYVCVCASLQLPNVSLWWVSLATNGMYFRSPRLKKKNWHQVGCTAKYSNCSILLDHGDHGKSRKSTCPVVSYKQPLGIDSAFSWSIDSTTCIECWVLMATVNQGTQQRLQIINDYALAGSGAEDPSKCGRAWEPAMDLIYLCSILDFHSKILYNRLKSKP